MKIRFFVLRQSNYQAFTRVGAGRAAALCLALALPLGHICQNAMGAPARQSLRAEFPIAKLPQPTGTLVSTSQMNLTICLPLRNQQELTNLLQQIYDPKSPEYRHYLTPDEFAKRFGPTESDYQAVIAYARSRGLIVTDTHPNRTLVDVSGSVATVENAFHVTLHTYQHPTENRTFYAPDTAPSVDISVPVLTVSGLNNFVLPKPMDLKYKPLGATNASPAAGSGPNGWFAGYDFRKAYLPNTTLRGQGQTVGLVQFLSGFYQSDISRYEAYAGLPNVPIQTVLLNGWDGSAGIGNDEVSLDIEMAISMAPGLSKVIVYEGFNTDDILNRIATDNEAKQIGASWTYPVDSGTDQILLQMAAQGQTYFNASGDSDAYLTGTISTPADNPNLVSVGGTTLTTDDTGAWESEKVWNWGAGIGTGGGISSVHQIPSWQASVDMTANGGSVAYRNIPDVALTADNIYVISGNGREGSVGGTSAATPLWAALTALINQQATAGGKPTVGFLNPALYNIGASPQYASAFHDIVTGDNTSDISPDFYHAVPGYDLCTGWGTPAGQALIDALAGTVPRTGLLQISVDPASGSPLLAGATQAVFVTVTDVSGVTNADVNASISGVTNFTLLDDGNPPDVIANDGVYSASFEVPNTLGPLTMSITADADGEIGVTNAYAYTVVPSPLNDNFVNATKVPPGGASYQSDNRFATIEPGEPDHAGDTNAVASLWWDWTAQTNGGVSVSVVGTSFQAVLGVYTGSVISNLTSVTSLTNYGVDASWYAQFNAVAGKTYHIALAGAAEGSVGPFRIAVKPGGQPDTVAPVVVVANPLSGLWVSNKIAIISGSAGDPEPNASGVQNVTVFVNGSYSFVAGGTTTWTGSVALNRGLNNLSVIARDFAGNVSTPFNLQLTYQPPADPANDLFANAMALTTTPEVDTVANGNATKEAGEPLHAGNPGGKSIWWWFRPPADGVLSLNTTNSDFDTLLAIYTGATVSSLTNIAANDDAYEGVPGGFSLLEQEVKSNVLYHIAVDGYNGASGTVSLNYSFMPAPAYHLTTESTAGGMVRVETTNSMGGINIMPGNSGEFAGSSQVALTGVPYANYAFVSWDGDLSNMDNPLSLVMTKDLNVIGKFSPASFADDFESGNLSHLGWAVSGDSPWFVQSDVVAAGQYAARSGMIGDSQSSTLSLTTNLAAGIVSFDYRVSSETNFDVLKFYVDGALIQQWSGEVGWANLAFPITAGAHTLKWTYSKDASIVSGLDSAFLDNLALPFAVPIDASSPAKLHFSPSESGGFTLTLKGQVGQQYVIQTSTDLFHWQNISTNIAVDGSVEVPISGDADSARFYRAVVLQ